MLIRLVAPGQPISGKNHKDAFVVPAAGGRASRAVVVTGKAVRKWYGTIVPILAKQYAAVGQPTIKQFVHVDLHQFLKHDVLANSSPDGDNVQSACWDALVKAFVLADDKLIVTWGGSRQQDAARPRVEIEIRLVERP